MPPLEEATDLDRPMPPLEEASKCTCCFICENCCYHEHPVGCKSPDIPRPKCVNSEIKPWIDEPPTQTLHIRIRLYQPRLTAYYHNWKLWSYSDNQPSPAESPLIAMAPDYYNFQISNTAPPGGEATIQQVIALIHWFIDRLEVANNTISFNFLRIPDA